MNQKRYYLLTDEQKKYILDNYKLESFSRNVSYLFGSSFSFEQTMAVYNFMNRQKCFDFVSCLEFHNEVLRLAKTGIDDNDICAALKDKYKNIGIYQVSAVIIANSKSRRVGHWTDADRRIVRLLYGENTKKALLRVLYPRLLNNIQKQASKLNLIYDKPESNTGLLTTDYLTVGELRKVLSEYKDTDKFYVLQVGSPNLVQIARIGHIVGKAGEHLSPAITVWADI